MFSLSAICWKQFFAARWWKSGIPSLIIITSAAGIKQHFFILLIKIISFWLVYFKLVFISFHASNRLFYSLTKSDFKIFIFYCYSNFFQVFVARRTLVANNNNESKCKWILNLQFTFWWIEMDYLCSRTLTKDLQVGNVFKSLTFL